MTTGSPRLLLDMPNWLGDLCHTLPAVDRLIGAHGRDAVTLLVPPAHVALARLLVRDAVARPAGAGWRWARAHAGEPDAALTARHATRAKLLLAGVRARRRLASAGRGAALLGLETFPVDRARHQRHDLDAALGRLGLAPAGVVPARLALPAVLAGRGRQVRAELTAATRVVALLPACHALAAKRYPGEGFGSVGRALATAGTSCLVVVGPGEEPLGEETAAAAGGRLVPGVLPLDEVAALLVACDAAVGNDSGLTHLAAVAGCPTVALFGPTDPARTAPVGGATVLRAPAGRPLADLPAAAIAAAVLQLVG